jgi:F-type H+-transporting ATPase subunit epsilon
LRKLSKKQKNWPQYNSRVFGSDLIMASFQLSVVTPTGAIIDSEISEATLPGAVGEFGVLPSHQPALIMLGGGRLSYVGPEGPGELLIRGGVAEVRADAVLVLTDRAISPADADRAEAQAILDAANESSAGENVLDDSAVLQLAADRGYAEAALK